MNRAWHKAAVRLMWLSLPRVAWTDWSVWDQLPARMAVHFDANWQPNGYTSRQGAVRLGLGIRVVMPGLFTVAMRVIDTLKPIAFRPALVISYMVLGCWYGNDSIGKFNGQGQRSEQNRAEKLNRRERRDLTECAETGPDAGKSGSQFLVAARFTPGVSQSPQLTTEN